MVVRVLSWNLFHGRALPPRDEDLLGEFAATLAGWEWDVALLQEVPPWWPPALAAGCAAVERHALTSRNALAPVRRALARRHPELMRANGGGCNAILLRGGDGTVVPHAWRRLCRRPERRVVHAVHDGAGRWFANLHASTSPPAAHREIALARATAQRWAAGAPLVLGGDLNVRDPSAPGFAYAGGHHVDHVFARGWTTRGEAELLERGGLSDHAPLRVALQLAGPSKCGSPASGVDASA